MIGSRLVPVDHPRTRPPQSPPPSRPPSRQNRSGPPLPPQGGPRGGAPSGAAAPGRRVPPSRGAARVTHPPARSSLPRMVRAAPRLLRALRNAPNPRLTALGTGLFCMATMFLLACLDLVLLDGSAAVYGVMFLPVSALTAL